MAKYFHISTGLRGCYMPDNVYCIKADTRRELKEVLLDEAERTRESCSLNMKDVPRIAAAAWREAHKKNPTYLDFVIPYSNETGGDKALGIFASVATRKDYLEFCKESDNG